MNDRMRVKELFMLPNTLRGGERLKKQWMIVKDQMIRRIEAN